MPARSVSASTTHQSASSRPAIPVNDHEYSAHKVRNPSSTIRNICRDGSPRRPAPNRARTRRVPGFGRQPGAAGPLSALLKICHRRSSASRVSAASVRRSAFTETFTGHRLRQAESQDHVKITACVYRPAKRRAWMVMSAVRDSLHREATLSSLEGSDPSDGHGKIAVSCQAPLDYKIVNGRGSHKSFAAPQRVFPRNQTTCGTQAFQTCQEQTTDSRIRSS
jgi:hypothetical protein